MTTWNCYSKLTFFDAIRNAQDGDVVLGTGIIDLTGERDIIIDKLLTFIGVKLLHKQRWRVGVADVHWLLRVVKGLKLDRCSIQGSPYKLVGPWEEYGLQTHINATDGCQYLTISKCQLSKATYAAVFSQDCLITTINNGTVIREMQGDAFAYAHWLMGDGNAFDRVLWMDDVYVDRVRHVSDAHYNTGHRIITNCTFSNYLKAAIGQHTGKDGQDMPGIGGGSLRVTGNKFLDRENFAFSLAVPQDSHCITIYDNLITREFGKAGELEVMDYNDIPGKRKLKDNEHHECWNVTDNDYQP